MFEFLKNFYWLPPAETRLPWSAIFAAFQREPANFSKSLCNYLNVDHCILGESARVLLFKVLEVLKEQGNGTRDEVLIPGYTCYSVAAAAAKAGLKISVYDLDPFTLQPDADSFRKSLSEKTLAAVVQHLFGVTAPVEELKQLAHQHGAHLIEDAAQALGKGNGILPPGTTGDFGLFSFGRGKPLPMGAGGALVSTNQYHVLDAIQLVSGSNGFKLSILYAATQFVSKPYLYWIPEMLPLGLGETVFDPGFKVEAMPNALEAMLVKGLPSLDRLNQHRKEISNSYSEAVDPKRQLINPGQATSIIRFPVILPNGSLTKELKRLGVRRMYPSAIAKEAKIKPYLAKDHKTTLGAEEIASKLFTLPTHLGIDVPLARKISDLIKKSTGVKHYT